MILSLVVAVPRTSSAGEPNIPTHKFIMGFPTSPPPATPTIADSRRMVCAELMGAHSHETATGVQVHVWLRDGKYLARGRFHGQPFGEALGTDPLPAAVRLRQILNDLTTALSPGPATVGRSSFPMGEHSA